MVAVKVFPCLAVLVAVRMRNQGDGVVFERLNDYHLLAGIGAEYGFGSGIAVRGELVAHETDAKYGQISLVYRLGSAAPRRASTIATYRCSSCPTPEATSNSESPLLAHH